MTNRKTFHKLVTPSEKTAKLQGWWVVYQKHGKRKAAAYCCDASGTGPCAE